MSELPAGKSSVSIEQILLLNDEMAALVRAGVPLGRGLIEVADDLPGQSARLAAELGKRLESGETLDQILATNAMTFPPAWRAVLLAGLRSGDLTSALEEVSSTARRALDLRQGLRVAMVYPIMIVILAFGCFVLLTVHVAPTIARANADLGGSSNEVLSGLVWLGERALWWGIAIPGLALGVCLLVRQRMRMGYGRKSMVRSGWLRPLVHSPLRDGRLAAFSEMLALLVNRQVPMDEAILLAGEASGDPAIGNSASYLAERIRRGEQLAVSETARLDLPPLLTWLLATNRQSIGLVPALRQFAQQRRDEAARRAAMLVSFFPVVMTAVVGGIFTSFYAAALFWPLSKMLFSLGTSTQ